MTSLLAATLAIAAVASVPAPFMKMKINRWSIMSLSEVCHLLSRAIPGRTPHDIFRRVRVLMYALLNPFAARIWLKALTTNFLLAEIAVRNRRFLERPFRCFAQADMPACARASCCAVIFESFGSYLMKIWCAGST
jgi:hypothetical protein